MKKLFSLLTFLLIAAGAWAFGYYTPSSAYTQGDAVIYATVSTNEPGAAPEDYEVGAFVDGVCIGQAFPDEETGIFVIRARGNEALVGKTIEFRAYNYESKLEYALTPSQTITFQLTGTYGYPSNTVTLTLKAATSYSLADVELEVGETVDLRNYLTMTPSDATLPLNAEWTDVTIRDNNPVSYDGNNMTGELIGSGRYRLVVNKSTLELNYKTLASANYKVVKHATAINIITESITVVIDDGESLSMFMRNSTSDVLGLGQAYELTPDDATDEVYWELKNDGIIEQQESNVWYPVKGGTTQIRPYFINKSGTKVYPANNKWITVNVIVPVQGIAFNTDVIYANVGDDIYQRLLNHLVFTPSDATNKNVTFSQVDCDNLTISGNSVVVKAKGYSGDILVTTEDGGKTASIGFEFFDPLKEVTFKNNPLNIDKSTSIGDAEIAIAGNIIGSVDDVQYNRISLSGVLSGDGGTEDDEWVVYLDNIVLQKGSATVTVTCGWQEYSTNDDGTDLTIRVWGSPKSFIVNIGVTLNKMIVTVTPDTNDPTKGVITLTPDPSDADINWTDFPVSVLWYNILFPMDNPWNTIKLSDNVNGKINYTTGLPGNYVIEPVGGSDAVTFEVPYKSVQASGWQWRSNWYGEVIEGGATTFESFFGDNFDEARTFNDLLINDPSWGLFGTMLNKGIRMAEMYKLKMKGAHTGFLYRGDSTPTLSYENTLSQGWNWIGSPFLYNRLLANAINTDGLVKNMVIASKSDGSVEWDGTKWVGNLKAIKSGEGYLVYTPSTPEKSFSFAEEILEMLPGNEDGGSSGAPRHDAPVWQYDHTQFADNMTMVAAVDGITDSDRYSIGAFVGDECRGEGEFIDGLAFITVHVNGSEKVTFRLYDSYTGEFFNVDQTIASKLRLGSLDAPVRLTSQSFTDGISTISVDNGISGETFDTNGRRLNSLQRGINIIRQADGTVRKVIKR